MYIDVQMTIKQNDVFVLLTEHVQMEEWWEKDQLIPMIEKKIGTGLERASLMNPSKQHKPHALDFLLLEIQE